ncbi:hypothetical protein SPLC1_S530300 [Arthrospira platensis C1]|nr:hypothetical protein SPLC1_S530300 [Arthrospira platensis C1]
MAFLISPPGFLVYGSIKSDLSIVHIWQLTPLTLW